MSALAQPPPGPCGITINFGKPDVFCTQKCERPQLNPLPPCSHWTTSLATDVLYGQSLDSITSLSKLLSYPLFYRWRNEGGPSSYFFLSLIFHFRYNFLLLHSALMIGSSSQLTRIDQKSTVRNHFIET